MLVIGVLLMVGGLAAMLWLAVRDLRAESRATAADRAAQRRIARRPAEVLPAAPPPPPPAKPVFEPLAQPAWFPVGVHQYTPVWLAGDRRDVLAHRLKRGGKRTSEGFLVKEGYQRFGATMPAGLAIANRNVRFCPTCWPERHPEASHGR